MKYQTAEEKKREHGKQNTQFFLTLSFQYVLKNNP